MPDDIITGTSDIPIDLQGWYDRNLIENTTPNLCHGNYGGVRPVPKNSGDRIVCRGYNPLAPATTPLDEYSSGTGKKMSVYHVYGRLKQYGDYIKGSDWINMVGLDANLMDIAGGLLADQAGETMDIVHRDKMVVGTSVRYASAAASRDAVANAISDADLDIVLRTLKGNKAKPIREMTKPGPNVASVPLRPTYIWITHTDCQYDIERLTGFKSVEEFASQDNIPDGCIGSVKDFLFVLTTQAKIWESSGVVVASAPLLKAVDSTNIDVYASIVLGKNAYDIVPLQRKTIKNIVHKPGSGGTSDALDMVWTSGWKAATELVVTNQDNMIRVEHGVTSLTS